MDLDYIVGMNDVGLIAGGYHGQGVFGRPSLGAHNSPKAPGARGVFQEISCPNNGIMEPKGINDQGVIVGACFYPGQTPSGGALRAFVYDNGKLTTFEHEHGFNTVALSVSNSGVIAGSYQPAEPQANGKWGGPALTRGFAFDGTHFMEVASTFSPDGGEHPTGVNSHGDVTIETRGIFRTGMANGALKGQLNTQMAFAFSRS